MENPEQIKARLRELFLSQKLGVLSTHDQGQPYASLMAFAASEDLKQLVFATKRSTRKFANLTADPRAAMLIDSRSNRAADIHEAMAVTATGTTREIADKEKDPLAEAYLEKHPHLEDFVKSPGCALVRMDVDCYYTVRQFQKVTELHIRR